MKLRNKISRRAQAISAIAVAVIFGGGWLAVWKWPHIQFRYRISHLDSETRGEVNRLPQSVVLPTEVPPQWRRYDFGFATLALPGVVVEAEKSNELSIRIKTDQCIFWAGGLGSSWGASEMMEQESLHFGNADHQGKLTQADLVGLTMDAYRATEEDFSWSLPDVDVFSLEQKLRLKAFGPKGPRGETRLFETPRLRGMIVYPPLETLSQAVDSGAAGRRAVSVQAAPIGNGNAIGFFVLGADGSDIAPQVAASVQFADQQSKWDRAAVSSRIDALIANWIAMSQPAQP